MIAADEWQKTLLRLQAKKQSRANVQVQPFHSQKLGNQMKHSHLIFFSEGRSG
jgi:hypothetical protein